MRTIGSFMLTSVVLAAAATASACPNCKRGYVFGPAVAVGNGMAFTWAKLGTTPGKVDSLGVTFTETAFEGLPDLADMPMPMKEFDLELPSQVKGLPFDHVGIDWNPRGHPPFEIYGKGHFDIHFYTISQEARANILARGGDLKKCNKRPEASAVPTGYILPPGTVVPNMGTHWVDPASPEFHGKPFTTTFLYGSYNGRTAFYEPMITRDFLASKPDFHQPLPVAKAQDLTGFYPSAYSVKYNEARKEVSISLDGLKYVEAGKPSINRIARAK
jgi:hypothetical protein